jgi:serine phosphatase RsbU (regulator of sigma subunit)
MPVDGSLPASVTARSGGRILLRHAGEALAFDPGMAQIIEATGCQAWAVLPLSAGERVLGALCVGWSAPQDFPAAELEILDALAAQCAQGLDRIQIRAAERRSAAAARRMSATLQRSLLTDPPRPPGLQIAVRYRPAAREAQVGGDWYDAFRNADGGTSLVIGDVAGHDRDAAAAMGQFRNLLRGIAYAVAEPPAKVLSALDRAVRDLAVGSLATAVLARVEPAAGDVPGARLLTWSNAGHPPPLLVDPDGSVHVLATDPDLLLGLDPDTGRCDHSRVVRPGGTLLLFTDGLVERRDASLDDGLDALVEAVRGLAGRSLDELCDGLLDRLGAAGDDDIALLVLHVEEPA